MVAAKEKTFFRFNDIKSMSREPLRQPAATAPPTAINRISSYDFTARKFKKSPIGPKVETTCIVSLEIHQRREKTLGENHPQLRRTHWAPGMSLYRGYFVPGAVDPWGLNCFDCDWFGAGEKKPVVRLSICVSTENDCEENPFLTDKETEECECAEKCKGKIWPVFSFEAIFQGTDLQMFKDLGQLYEFKTKGISKQLVLGNANDIYQSVNLSASLSGKDKLDIDCCDGSQEGTLEIAAKGSKLATISLEWSIGAWDFLGCGSSVLILGKPKLGAGDSGNHRIECKSREKSVEPALPPAGFNPWEQL